MQSSEMILDQVLKSAVYPMLAGAVTGFVLSKLTKKTQARDWIPGSSLLVGFLVGFFALAGFEFPPIKVSDWLPYGGGSALLFGLLFNKSGMVKSRLGVGLCLAILLWIYLKPLLHSWSMVQFVGAWALCLVLWQFLFWCWEPGCDPEDHPELWLPMVVAATGASLISVLDGSALIGQIGGVLASTCGGLFLARWFLPTLHLGFATRFVFVAVFGSLLVNGFFYGPVTPLAVILVFVAGCAAVLVRLAVLRSGTPTKRAIWVIAAGLVPVITAVLILLLGSSGDAYDY